MISTLSSLLDSISAGAFIAESEAVDKLLEQMAPYECEWDSIHIRARSLIEQARGIGAGAGVEAFLQEYSLSSHEGAALMCLAEALLRIPDPETANRLISYTFDDTEWDQHIGHSPAFTVNASSWGLLLTGKWLHFTESDSAHATLSRFAGRVGAPVVRTAMKAAMRVIASQFVLGETIEDALSHAVRYEKGGYCFSYDMLGEGARTQDQAQRYFESYRDAIRKIGAKNKQADSLYAAPGISIKLTALHPRYEWAQRKRVMRELLPLLKILVTEARTAGICVSIDAEESTRLDLELELFAALFLDPELAGYEGLGFVLQAYQKRAWPVIDLLLSLSRETGRRMPVRLVKGAYWDSEIKAAQVAGLPDYPVFTVKAHSDISYLACARRLFAHPECFYPQFATHNAVTIAAIEAIGGEADYEFQRLYGMGDALYSSLPARHRCRIYAPVGQHRDLLAYLIRRLLENGANSSFLHLLWDPSQPFEAALENPIERARSSGSASTLPLPRDIYGNDRVNSHGVDFGNRAQMQALEAALSEKTGIIAVVPDLSAGQLDGIITGAQAAFASWQATPVQTRAEYLERAGQLLESRMEDAVRIIVAEGHRTLPDAISEWREAIDFCRYYAAWARELFAPRILPGPTGEQNSLSLHGRGVFACVSPWNFPLAIFVGQVTAALAAGNCVIAKPAEQTPATAQFTVDILHEAGVPKAVLQLAAGSGETIGAALVTHKQIAGVAFTGSFATAKSIARALAAREGAIIPFIAETGGINAMVVDSSALPEQAIDDIIRSAFGSTGQRCSALRIVYMHQDIAEMMIELLRGAMAELSMGDPALFSTDVGPVIDAEAKAGLDAHISRMSSEATLIAATPLPGSLPPHQAFVAPHAFEITAIEQIGDEIFGPILHVIRYDPRQLDDVIHSIHAQGYGLTFGIHSRIPAFYESIVSRIAAGNYYVNRSMIGAVVGVQPFGGEGLSGTGPKAGSPFTLLRYANERVTSINSAAIGGNIDLLMR